MLFPIFHNKIITNITYTYITFIGYNRRDKIEYPSFIFSKGDLAYAEFLSKCTNAKCPTSL